MWLAPDVDFDYAGIVTFVRALATGGWSTVAAAALGLASALYAALYFSVKPDTERLLPSDLPWQQHQLAYAAVFPPHQIIAVVEAPTPELTDIAADRLVASLQKRTDLFTAVLRPGGGEFTEKSGASSICRPIR